MVPDDGSILEISLLNMEGKAFLLTTYVTVNGYIDTSVQKVGIQ